MSELRPLALVLSLLAADAAGAAAQIAHPPARTPREARAYALKDSLVALDRQAQQRNIAAARRATSGPVLLILRSSESQETADEVASLVWKALREFQVFSDSLLRTVAMLDDAVGSSGQVVEGRRALAFPRPGGLDEQIAWWRQTKAEVLADNALWTVSDALLRDSLSRVWLERRLDPRTDSAANSAVVEDLAIGRWEATRGCIMARADDCVRYLGIEVAPDFRTRFSFDELRAEQEKVVEHSSQNTANYRCWRNDDSACLEVAHGYFAPASMGARRSFVLFIKTRYGVAAARTLLDGTGATLGERVRTATGQDPTVSALAWREWVLTTGQRKPVEAGLRWFFSVALLTGGLLYLTTRGGRWVK